MLKKKLHCFRILTVLCFCGLFPAMVQAAQFKVLAVMSYEEDFTWTMAIKQGIDSALADTCEVRYFYMDTKKNLEGGPEKATQAHALYQEFQPDGVITADDNAQSMFVVPYLKDKVKTPVMFCGVNAEPEKYGYPASNVSGILERLHLHESVVLAKNIVPSIRNFGFIIKYSPTADAILRQIKRESDDYPAKFVAMKTPKTLKEAVTMTEELREQCDLLFLSAVQGLAGEGGEPVIEKEAVSLLVKTFGKPTISTEEHNVKHGTLCAVSRTGQEQGRTAAKMLLKAMQGTRMAEIPITQNYQGKRIINATVIKTLGIKPKLEFLIGAEVVKTEE
ncbi:MAG: ABC transporter substrate-binding protein [Deltaproteobacteria bacterium]|nr:MAG: ABC transporter substrate-binding protein [Deltaproteobacteria bacterium]